MIGTRAFRDCLLTGSVLNLLFKKNGLGVSDVERGAMWQSRGCLILRKRWPMLQENDSFGVGIRQAT